MPVEIRVNDVAGGGGGHSAIDCTADDPLDRRPNQRRSRRHSLHCPRSKRLKTDEFSQLINDVVNRTFSVLSDAHDPDVQRAIRSFAKGHLRNLERYGFVGRAGNVRAAKSLEWQITRSHRARVVAFILSYSSRRPKLPFAHLIWRARDVNLWHPSGECVRIHGVAKSDGGYRFVGELDLIERARSELARQLVAARHSESQYEYCRRGRGRDAAVSAIVAGAMNDGVRAIGTLDIKDFFSSIRKEAVYEVVKLPRTSINNTIFVSEDSPIVVLNNDHQQQHISECAVRSGLLQGALSSPLVAGKVLEPCLEKIPARLKLTYLDNIAFGAAAVCEVQVALKALTASLETQYPGAPLFTKWTKVGKIGARVDILGYWLRPNKKADGGGTRVTPSNEAINRRYVRLATELLQVDCEVWDHLIDVRITRWANSFGKWTGRAAGSEIAACQFIDMCWRKLVQVQEFHSAESSATLLDASTAQIAAHQLVPKNVLARLSGGPPPMLAFT